MLSLLGKFCSCLEKEEDRRARHALHELTVAGQRVSWFTKGGLHSTVAKGARKLLGGLFGAKTAAVTPSEDSSIVEARLVFRDNDENNPEIFVDPLPRPSGQSVGYKLNIALYRIHRIEADDTTGEIKMHRKAPRDPQQRPPDPLLTIGLLTDSKTPATADARGAFCDNLSILCEWERQRRSAAGIEDDPEEESGGGGNFLTQRANKAAHFAKRELEMQQTKRDREKRKAKFVAESGGLRYTALAMANMDSSENSSS